MIKTPYEISLWEDVLTWVYTDINGNIQESTSAPTEILPGSQIFQYFNEVKLCNIGADSMNSGARVINPIFTKNINGSKTLTFSLYFKYFDNTLEDKVENPFVELLQNERKIKLKYDGKWYDFVIKNQQKSSDNKTINYIAKSLEINELSKTGFNLEFDTELENNQGTILELAQPVLDGTEWEVDLENSDIFRQYVEEPLYSGILRTDITVSELLNPEKTHVVPAGQELYLFYSQLDKTTVQVLIPSLTGFYYDENNIIVEQDKSNAINYELTGIEWINELPYLNGELLCNNFDFNSDYRGLRLSRGQVSVYDEKIDKFVNVYTDSEGNEVYGYEETRYISPTLVSNLITNPSYFTHTGGWTAANKELISIDYSTVEDLGFSVLTVNDTKVTNSGIKDNRNNIKNFIIDDTYICRIKSSKEQDWTIKVVENKIGESVEEDVLIFNDFTKDENGFLIAHAAVKKNVSFDNLLDSNYIYNIIVTNSASPITFTQIELFKEVNVDGKYLAPGEAPPDSNIIQYEQYYYDPKQNAEKYDSDTIVFLSNKEEYFPVFDKDYNKIRSISVKESNRFNIIQTLCETFECWADFQVEHDEETGKILLRDDYTQKKSVRFLEHVGKENYAGFRYGVNVKSIQRSDASDQIVTKIIVKNNANEFATDGFCSIARADENPIKENYLYDFTYYFRQGLLSSSLVNNDLYLDTNGYIGLYKILKQQNKKRDELILLLSEVANEINNVEALVQVYSLAYEGAKAEYNNSLGEYKFYTGVEYNGVAINDTDSEETKIITAIKAQDANQKAYLDLYNKAVDDLNKLQTQSEEIDKDLEAIKEIKKEAEDRFYKKYSRFIQEGSWISEDYIDDNLYYFDAQSTLRTSAIPQVTYNINVLELSKLEGFYAYSFEIGDKTYVEDPDFFGYYLNEGILTPYKQDIVVTEVKHSLDDPSQDSIKVQNYKTQFEDLFQRIAATSQTVQYHSGTYERMANAVNTDGTIKSDILQNTLIRSSYILSNAKDQSVVWDDTGLTATNLRSPNEIVRMISGGIFITSDGGQTWSSAITGAGINANFLSTGQIDTSLIKIANGNFESFRWDPNGLSAYAFTLNEAGAPSNFNYNRFIRYDQYGLYGYTGDNKYVPTSLDDVVNNSKFSLTWDGLRFNNSQNEPVLITGNDGDLWLQNTLSVGADSSDPIVKIGYNNEPSKYKLDGIENESHEIINANDKFIVYQDGHIEAKSGTFTGTINATGGKIGNMTIDSLEEDLKKLDNIVDGEGNVYIIDINDTVITKEDIDGTNLAPKILSFGLIQNGEHIIKNLHNDYYFTLHVSYPEIEETLIISNSNDEDNTLDNQLIWNEEIEGERPLVFDEITGKWKFNLELISSYIFEESEGQELTQEQENLVYLQNTINSKHGVLRIEIKKKEDDFSVGLVEISSILNISDALLDFEVTSTQIKAAVDNKSLTFSEKGLEVYNTGLTIYDNNDVELLGYDPLSKTLKIVGSGTFTGDIYANNGYFKGEIEATSGSFENSKINSAIIGEPDNGLELGIFKDNEIAFSGVRSTPLADGTRNLIINSQGHIIANSIELGIGATISEYIKLGNAILQNPTIDDNSVLKINIKGEDIFNIQNDGIINFGNIKVDSENSIIEDTEGAWRITPDTSIFNDVSIKGKISTAVFESQSSRISGGSMLFKDGSLIKSFGSAGENTFEIYLDDISFYSIDNYVLLTQDGGGLQSGFLGKVTAKDEDNNKLIIESVDARTIPSTNYNLLINLGEVIDNHFKDWSIGINSTNTTIETLGLKKNSITFNAIDLIDNKLSFSPQIILGDLSEVQALGDNNTGLFANNVFLRGTLSTAYEENGDQKYAGVNTISGATFNKTIDTLEQDRSKIIFWAGSDGTDANSIQDAKFQVTSDGTLFATQGYFKGSIITDSMIEAARIVTPIITGNGEQYPLIIETDSTSERNQKGFLFRYNQNNGSSKDIISFTSNNSIFNNDVIINDSNKIQLKNSIIVGDNISSTNVIAYDNNNNIILSSKKIEFYEKNQDSSINIANMIFNGSENKFVFEGKQKKQVLDLGEKELYSRSDRAVFANNVSFGEKMEYKKIINNDKTIGYDLYIFE